MIRRILQIGEKQLKIPGEVVTQADAPEISGWVRDLHDTLMHFRQEYGAGRAVSLPQIGIRKRLIYAYLDKPYVIMNPVLTFPDDERCIVRDDCMSYPGYIVEVERHKRAVLSYLDEHFRRKTVFLEGDYAELFQHEYDHLDGITIDMRAADENAIRQEQMTRNLDQSGFPPLREIEIRQAEMQDLDGVKALLKANHVDNLTEAQRADGFVTTNMTDAQMQELSAMKTGITIASDSGKVVAFAFAAAWDYWKQWPFFVNMIGELPKYHYLGQELSTENSYQYGPVCVDRAYRGQGIFETLFQTSLEGMSDRFPVMVTFVNHKNPRSHAAHTKKAKMDVLGDFDYNGNSYYLLACATKRHREQMV